MKRVLSLALVLLMLLPALIACGGTGDGDVTTGGAPVVSTGEGDYVSKLPQKNYPDGTMYRIIGRESGDPEYSNFEVYVEGSTGDVVGDAVYTRNQSLKNKYNLDIDYTPVESVGTAMQSYFDTQEDMYDLCIFRGWELVTFAQSGYLLDIGALPNIDLEHPAWNQELNKEVTISDKLLFTTNNFLLQDKMRTGLIFYNREMARSNGFIEQDQFMEEVYVDGNNWTLDVFAEMVKKMSWDIDGGGAGGLGDHFGLAADDKGQFRAFCIGAGLKVANNDDGVITLNRADIAMQKIVAEVAKFGFEDSQVLYSNSGVSTEWADAENIFIDGRALFHSAFVGSFAEITAGAQFEYGVLPYPKLNGDQTRYYTGFNVGNSSMFTVPYTILDRDFAGFCLEAISEESQYTTYPAFIRDKVQLQDAYDEVSAKKLELIFDSLSLDAAALFLDGNGELYAVLYDDIMKYKKADRFKVLYDSKYDKAEIKFTEIMNNFAAND